jgi:hypothetical protein
MTGPDVKAVQEALNCRLHGSRQRLAEDGIFGPLTQAAVQEFQRLNKLQPDSIVGPRTRAALFPLVSYACHISASRAAGSSGQPGSVPGGGAPPTFQPPKLTPLKLPSLNLPVPSLLSPTPAGFHLDNVQVQAGEQHTFSPFLQLHPPSPNPADALILTVQGVFLRSSDDRHLEITPGLQLGVPLSASASDGSNWSLQYFTQFTAADLFWHFGRLHLVSPFAQITFQHGLGSPAHPTLGVGLFPVNITYELIRNRRGDPVLSLFGQAGEVGTWDLSTGHFETGLSAAGGLQLQFGAKK